MKRIFYKTLIFMMVMAAVFSSLTAYAWEYKYCGANPITEISVSLDGRLIEFDVPPQIINNRTMVPVRAIFEELRMNVEWDEEKQTITASYPGVDIEMVFTIGGDILKAHIGSDNYKNYRLDSPAVIVDGRTLVPLRAIAEVLDWKVVWEPDIKYVHIASLHKGNYRPSYTPNLDAAYGNYYCDAICDNRGRRWIYIYAEGINEVDDVFIETQNGEYIFMSNGDNLTITPTDNGYIYSIDYIPFPDTYIIYCYPAKDGAVADKRTMIKVNWNRT